VVYLQLLIIMMLTVIGGYGIPLKRARSHLSNSNIICYLLYRFISPAMVIAIN